MTGQDLLAEHVSRFNAAIRSGSFESFLELCRGCRARVRRCADRFFSGRAAIAAAYREQPPDDEIRVLGVRETNRHIVADYSWLATPDTRAGEMRVDHDGGRIQRLVVTFG